MINFNVPAYTSETMKYILDVFKEAHPQEMVNILNYVMNGSEKILSAKRRY